MTLYKQEKTVTVTNASTLLLTANPNRVGFSITNLDGALILSISEGHRAVADAGTVLQPKETHWETKAFERDEVWTGEVAGVFSAAGPGNVAISETIQGD